MKKININFLENFRKNKIDEKYLELYETKLGIKFGKKYKEFLIKFYQRNIDNSKPHTSKYFIGKFITFFSLGIPYTDNQGIINPKDMSLSGSISIIKDSTKSNFYIGIGLEGTEIEDQLFIINRANESQYISSDINEFIDSLYDEYENNINLSLGTYHSNQLIQEDILMAEKDLGLNFPDNYKKFLLETGGGEICPPDIIDDNTNKVLDYHYNDPNKPIFYNKYSPKEDGFSNDYTIKIFSLSEILDYWNLFKEYGTFSSMFNLINDICKIIPIGFNGENGIFFIGAKGTENQGKIFFFNDDNEGVIENVGFICDSFEEYVNSFYWQIPDNINFTLKSSVNYYI